MTKDWSPLALSQWQNSFNRWITQVGELLPIEQGVLYLCDSSGIVLAGHLIGVDGEVSDTNRRIHPRWRRYPIYRKSLLSTPDSPELGMIFTGDTPPEHATFLLETCLMGLKNVYNSQLRLERDRKDVLYELTNEMLSKMEVHSILSELLERLSSLYPNIHIELFLSHDDHHLRKRIKPLSFINEGDKLSINAFMEGRIFEAESSDGNKVVAVPLIGNQGIYGVIRLAGARDQLERDGIQFLTMLGEATGVAFEKAKLYEQSNLLVQELRLINEITKKLNESLKMKDIFDFAAQELIDIYKADFACLLQVNPENNEFIVQSGNVPDMMHEKFSSDYGFSGWVNMTRQPLIISDYTQNPVRTSKFMEVTGARSVMASPIMIQSKVAGVVLVAHRKPDHFSYNNYKLLSVLSDHIGLALHNASLHAEVERMVVTDRLTGLFARHFLDEQINQLQKKDPRGALILLDIDHFKQVNDTFGHQKGDRVLIQVADILRRSIRDTDIAARWGGEELAIYLPQADMHQACRVAERIRKRVCEETEPSVSISGGVAEWNANDEKISSESLFYTADMNLYKAKNLGRNRIYPYDGDDD